MGFREQANFRQVMSFQRKSSVPGTNLYSKRFEQANNNSATLKTVTAAKRGESLQFQIKKNVYSRKLGGAQTESKVTTRRPKM